MRAASPPPTPDRSSRRVKLSPCPNVAVNSMRGRSGAAASGCTASVAAIRRPVSPPHANGNMVCARACSQSSGCIVAACAGMGFSPGQLAIAVPHSRVSVASPRHQVNVPMSRPKSGAQSMSVNLSRSTAKRMGAPVATSSCPCVGGAAGFSACAIESAATSCGAALACDCGAWVLNKRARPCLYIVLAVHLARYFRVQLLAPKWIFLHFSVAACG